METKVIPINYTDDLEELSKNSDYKCSYIGIDEISVTYIQPADTNSDSDEIQTIKLTSQCACAVGIRDVSENKGFYINIEIPEGSHWSIDDADDMNAIINDFKQRLSKGKEFIK